MRGRSDRPGDNPDVGAARLRLGQCRGPAAECQHVDDILQPAFASANVEGLLQNVVDMLTGNTARLLAILAVVIVGILWMFGLFDLRRAAIVILGIVVVFGAAEIVGLITGGA